MGTVEKKLESMGLALPLVAAPLAAYVPAVRSGALVYSSGQLPLVEGALPTTGSVGAEVSAEQAGDLARICALNALAAVKSVIGEPRPDPSRRQGRRVRGQHAGLHRTARCHQRSQ
jgi:enamine deaminase RidA (YjgF/YER057c/UK114 family)